jgi:hypothetical protein
VVDTQPVTTVGDTESGGTKSVDGAETGPDVARPAPSALGPDAAGDAAGPSTDGKAVENVFTGLTKPEVFNQIEKALLAKSQDLQRDYKALHDDLETHTKLLVKVTLDTNKLFSALPDKIQAEMKTLEEHIQKAKPTLDGISAEVEHEENAAAPDDATAKKASEDQEGEAQPPKDARVVSPSSLNESREERKQLDGHHRERHRGEQEVAQHGAKETWTGCDTIVGQGQELFDNLLASYEGKWDDHPKDAQQLKEFAKNCGIEVHHRDLAKFLQEKGLPAYSWKDEEELRRMMKQRG